MKVPISDPDSPTYVPPPAGEFPPTPVITINDVDTTGFNPLTQVLSHWLKNHLPINLGIHVP